MDASVPGRVWQLASSLPLPTAKLPPLLSPSSLGKSPQNEAPCVIGANTKTHRAVRNRVAITSRKIGTAVPCLLAFPCIVDGEVGEHNSGLGFLRPTDPHAALCPCLHPWKTAR